MPEVSSSNSDKIRRTDHRLKPLSERTKTFNDLVNPNIESANEVYKITQDSEAQPTQSLREQLKIELESVIDEL